eukprot:TRINITY_DN6270_c0_g1_i1.p1 TRINITY_DN6270_c0_g1~~TRINITY_DN6270_c0_g1_i1.p1  ORF type:complete len:77 (-),score=9.88 TRINITY_DN6270_c0_g1_i1:59-289(-)
MQINPGHPIIVGLHGSLKSDPSKARVVSRQMVNNAFVAAGLVDDAREMINDVNDVMSLALGVSFSPRVDSEQEADD